VAENLNSHRNPYETIMTLPIQSLLARAFSVTLCGTLLAACGGGSGSTPETTVSVMENQSLGSIFAGRGTVPQNSPATAPVTTSPVAPTKMITTVQMQSTSAKIAQTNVPFTFGQIFKAGDLQNNTVLTGRFDNGDAVPLQIDVKATHADGSVRHAVVSGVIPTLAAGQTRTLQLVGGGTAATGTAATTAQLLNSGFTAAFSATVNGIVYQASADQLIKDGKATTWLAGPNVTEWHVSAPLTAADGTQHRHLTARFAVRWYEGSKKARVDVAIENNWAYEPSPQNYTYDAQFLIGGKPVYVKPGFVHYHRARWRQLGWWGTAAPELNVKHDTAYLLATRALPNYDQSITVPESHLATIKTKWTGAITEPMNVGVANGYMPSTGGRNDIGLQPGWNVVYLLSMDSRARDIALGTASLAGTWPTHYRDKLTDKPISVIDYPYMTILGRPGDTYNRPLKRSEAFPACASVEICKNPFTADTSHQPNFAYLPYLVTGDYYYLEELQFWTMWSVFSSNPYYREFEKGLVHPDQVRGQAWTLRTLAEAAYITPDGHPLKSHFTRVMDSNLDWFNQTYVTGTTTSNPLGIITNGYSIVYSGNTGIGPWQDDFFTSAIGHAAELGFTKAEPLLRWKAKFPIDRMIGQGSCWIGGAMYTMKVRDSKTSPIYADIAQAFKASSPDYTTLACASAEMAKSQKLAVGEMWGYSTSTVGYPSNMQPALAYSADTGSAEGKRAWAQFAARTVKPDYSGAPQFAIVPR